MVDGAEASEAVAERLCCARSLCPAGRLGLGSARELELEKMSNATAFTCEEREDVAHVAMCQCDICSEKYRVIHSKAGSDAQTYLKRIYHTRYTYGRNVTKSGVQEKVEGLPAPISRGGRRGRALP